LLKLYGLIQRRADLSLEEFSRHWRTVHRELALRLVAPGYMRGYVQNHRRELELPAGAAPFDGCPELWIDSVETLPALATSPEYLEGAGPDESNFMTGSSKSCIGQPRFACGAPRGQAGPSKVLMFYTDGIDARTPWSLDRPWSLPGASALRIERDACLVDVPGLEPYVAIESSWWRDSDSFRDAWLAAARDRARLAPAMVLPVTELIVFLPDEIA
jgi:hypothetical protein